MGQDMRREFAEDVAVAALGWMAGDPDVMGAFLSASGLSASDLRDRVDDLAFLGGVLDFVLQRDDWVIAVAGAAGLAPDGVLAARVALPGGDLPHWT
jgi:hypothetical protein